MSTSDLDALLSWLWKTTWQAAILAAVVWVVTRVLRRWLSPGAVQMVWLLVFFRLSMPALPESSWSLLQSAAPTPRPVATFVEMPSEAFIPSIGMRPLLPSSTPPRVVEPIPWKSLALLSIWSFGAIWTLSRTLRASLRFARQLSLTAGTCETTVSALVESCCLERGTRVPEILVTDLIATPALTGVARPTLLLTPASLAMEPTALRGIILHELEHLRRRHLMADWLLTIIRSLHWFNPAAWVAHRQIRAARELICDRAVVHRLNEQSAIEYGHTMLDIAESLFLRSGGAAITAAFASDRALLRDRIDAIARGRRRYIAGLGIILASLLSAAFLTKPSTAQVGSAPASGPTTKSSFAENGISIPPTGVPMPGGASATQPKPLPYMDAMRFPENWPDLAELRALTRAQRNEENQQVRQKLEQILPAVDFEAITFNDVIEQLRKQTSLNIFVNWRAIGDAGLARTVPITVRLQGVTVATALDAVLRNAEGNKVKLAYSIDEGVITISTKDDLDSNVETRVFDIRDLLAPATAQTRAQLAKEFIRLVRETVAPDSWKDNNGKVGSIRELAEQLIVTQTPQNQIEILNLITELRRTRGSAVQIKLETRLITGAANLIQEQKLAGKWNQKANAEVWSEFLSDAQADTIFRASERDPESATITVPKLVLFDRQPSRMRAGTEKAYVKDFVLGRNGSIEPVVATVFSGADLQCEASVLAERTRVALKLHPKFTRLDSMAMARWKTPAGDDDGRKEVPMIQIPHLVVGETDQQFEIPSHMTLMIRIKLHRPDLEEAQDLDRVVLLVRAEVIEPVKR